jgi:hypothetical protein
MPEPGPEPGPVAFSDIRAQSGLNPCSSCNVAWTCQTEPEATWKGAPLLSELPTLQTGKRMHKGETPDEEPLETSRPEAVPGSAT